MSNALGEQIPPLPDRMEIVADTVEVYLELDRPMTREDMTAMMKCIREWRSELTAQPRQVEQPRLRLVFSEAGR